MGHKQQQGHASHWKRVVRHHEVGLASVVPPTCRLARARRFVSRLMFTLCRLAARMQARATEGRAKHDATKHHRRKSPTGDGSIVSSASLSLALCAHSIMTLGLCHVRTQRRAGGMAGGAVGSSLMGWEPVEGAGMRATRTRSVRRLGWSRAMRRG